jgi:hypothetical protein
MGGVVVDIKCRTKHIPVSKYSLTKFD